MPARHPNPISTARFASCSARPAVPIRCSTEAASALVIPKPWWLRHMFRLLRIHVGFCHWPQHAMLEPDCPTTHVHLRLLLELAIALLDRLVIRSPGSHRSAISIRAPTTETQARVLTNSRDRDHENRAGRGPARRGFRSFGSLKSSRRRAHRTGPGQLRIPLISRVCRPSRLVHALAALLPPARPSQSAHLLDELPESARVGWRHCPLRSSGRCSVPKSAVCVTGPRSRSYHHCWNRCGQALVREHTPVRAAADGTYLGVAVGSRPSSIYRSDRAAAIVSVLEGRCHPYRFPVNISAPDHRALSHAEAGRLASVGFCGSRATPRRGG